MLSPEILKKIKHLEISTRRLLSSCMVGDTRSALKGSGFEFDQIREYQVGDDIRFIDRNSSARMNKLLIKQYMEERSRTIIIVVDGSYSNLFSSSDQLRSDIIAQIASVLTIVANYGNDSVGLLIFSDKVDCYIPPSKGSNHVHAIMEHLFSYQPHQGKTSIQAALEKLAGLKNRNAMVFLISDFIDAGYEKKLRLIAKKYDVVALRCIDQFEQALPDLGFITIEDAETGELCTLDARGKGTRKASQFLSARLNDQKKMFKNSCTDSMDIYLHKPFIADLIRFFRHRMMY